MKTGPLRVVRKFFRRTPPEVGGDEPVVRAFRDMVDEYLRAADGGDEDRLFHRIETRALRARLRALPGAERRPGWWSMARAFVANPDIGLARIGLGPIGLATAGTALLVTLGIVAFSGGPHPVEPGLAPASTLGSSSSQGHQPTSVAAAVRRWTAGSSALTLNFADHSRVILAPGAVADLLIADEHRALIRLERGALDVDVEHHAGTNYRFEVGDYEVRVTGTAFDLGYEPEADRIIVKMRQGTVNVLTPEGTVQRVKAGESFERSRAGHVAVALPSSPSPETKANGAQNSADQRQASSSLASAGQSYIELARSGKFHEIVQDAEGRGLNAVLRSKGSAELVQLSHAARYVGHTDVAVRVLQALITTHARTSEGRAANFFLGRIAEARGDLSGASSSYEKYIRLESGGPYAGEALGRRMLLAQKSGDSRLAERLAGEYQANFRHGSYTAHASAISSRSSASGSQSVRRTSSGARREQSAP